MSKDIQVRKADSVIEPNLLFSDMDRFVDRFFADPFAPMLTMPKFAAPARSEVRETNEAYVLSAEVPGIPKDEISVEVSGNMLVIRAEHGESSDKEGASRRSYQSFHQTFTLPTTVDADNIEAHCEDGLLEVLMPKKASATSKKVALQTGKGSIWNRLKAAAKPGNGKKMN